MTSELDAELMNKFQQYIGVLRWAIKFGRIDINMEASSVSQHLASLTEGHIHAEYKIFRYLQKNLSKNPGHMVFDGAYPDTDVKLFATSVSHGSS